MSYNSRRNTIFVYNLDVNVSEVDFLSYFRKRYYASVKNGEIVQYSKNGKLFRHGIINFVDSASASKAVRDTNYLNGEKVICKYASTEWKDQKYSEVPQHMRELHVSNLNISVTNHQLIDYFQKFGPIVNARIMHDENNISVGYGFVEFYCTSSVSEVQEKRPHRINDQCIRTVRGYPRDVPTYLKKPSTTLCVYNYEQHTNEKHIEKYFSQFGCITLVSRKETRPDNIKFMELQFDDYDAVDKICLMDNHKINNCHTIKVSKYLGDNIEELANSKTGTEVQKITIPAADIKSNTNQQKSTKNQPSSKSTPHCTERDSESKCKWDILSLSSDNDSPSSRRRSRTKTYNTKKLTNTKTVTETQKITKAAADFKSNANQLKSTKNQPSSKCTPAHTEGDSEWEILSSSSDNDDTFSSQRGSRTKTYNTEKLTNSKTGTETKQITKAAADFKSNANQLKSTTNQFSSKCTPDYAEWESFSRTDAKNGTEKQKITKPRSNSNSDTAAIFIFGQESSTPIQSIASDQRSTSSVRRKSNSSTAPTRPTAKNLPSQYRTESFSWSSTDDWHSSRLGSRTETYNTNKECELWYEGRYCKVDMVTKRIGDGTEKLTNTKTETKSQETIKPAADFKSNTNQRKLTKNQFSSKSTGYYRDDWKSFSWTDTKNGTESQKTTTKPAADFKSSTNPRESTKNQSSSKCTPYRDEWESSWTDTKKYGTESQKTTKPATDFESNKNQRKSTTNQSSSKCTGYYRDDWKSFSWTNTKNETESQKTTKPAADFNSNTNYQKLTTNQSSSMSTPYYRDKLESFSWTGTKNGTESQKTTKPAADFNSNTNYQKLTTNQSSSMSTPYYRDELESCSWPSTKNGTESQKTTKRAADYNSNTNYQKLTTNQSSSICTPYYRDKLESFVWTDTKNGTESQKTTKPAADFNSNTNYRKLTTIESNSKCTPYRDEWESFSWTDSKNGTEKQTTTKPRSNYKSDTTAIFTFGEMSSTLIQSTASDKRSTSSVGKNPNSSKPSTRPTAKYLSLQDRPHQTSSRSASYLRDSFSRSSTDDWLSY